MTIPAGKSVGTYLAHAFPQAEPRTWPICAEGRVSTGATRGPVSDVIEMPPETVRGRRKKPKTDVAVASQLVDLRVTESPVKGTIGRIAGEQGTTLQVNCSLERQGELPDTLEAILEGLPNRVQADSVQIAPQSKLATFALKLDSTAPVGEFDSLVCRLTGTKNGQTVSFNVGRGGILKIVPPGSLVTDSEGRPLSPLEALRKTQAGVKPDAVKPDSADKRSSR